MPDPKVPNRNNPFEQFSSSLLGFLKKVEGRDKKRDEKLEKLIKQMIVYFQLLEKSAKGDGLTSKLGREESLKKDPGFIKLSNLMGDINDDLRDIMKKYIAGQRLVASEKVEIAKLVDGMKSALSESGEKIGIPVRDLLTNFKELISNSKLEESSIKNLVGFLKQYSEEDIALTDELRVLLDKISISNNILDEDIVKLGVELDKNIQNYTSDLKEATFAPFMKINNEIKESNIILDDIVKVLTEEQRRQKKKEDEKEFKERLAGRASGYVSDLGGGLVTGIIRAGAIAISEPLSNFANALEQTPILKDLPLLKDLPNVVRQIAPILAGLSGLMGQITTIWLTLKVNRLLEGGIGGLGKGVSKGIGGSIKGLIGSKSITDKATLEKIAYDKYLQRMSKGISGDHLTDWGEALKSTQGKGVLGWLEKTKNLKLLTNFSKRIPFLGTALTALFQVPDIISGFKKGEGGKSLAIAGGKVGGTLAGAASGGAAGAALGAFGGPIGIAIGGVIGSVLGAVLGEKFGGWLMEGVVLPITEWFGNIFKNMFGTNLDLGKLFFDSIVTPLGNLLDIGRGIKEFGKGVAESFSEGYKTTEGNVAEKTLGGLSEAGKTTIKGVKSLGQYIPGVGTWSSNRGSGEGGELVALDSNIRTGLVNDKPMVQKDFSRALSSAQEEMRKLYGKDSGITITGALTGINPKTGKPTHASKQHAVGTAVDIGNVYGNISKEEAIRILGKHGITRPNAVGDPIHFEYTPSAGDGRTTLVSKPSGDDIQGIPPTVNTSNKSQTVSTTPPPQKISMGQQSSERKLKSNSDIINVINLNGLFA